MKRYLFRLRQSFSERNFQEPSLHEKKRFHSEAFSMIELVFVIILLGILATVMQMNLPDHKLLSDTNFISQKIKAKQMQALSYDNFNYTLGQFRDDTTCILINKASINALEKTNASANPYQISAKSTLVPDDLNVCFDNLGRPYKLNVFQKMPIEFKIVYKSDEKTILIMPHSGSLIIKK